jgi:hypothetical protein
MKNIGRLCDAIYSTTSKKLCIGNSGNEMWVCQQQKKGSQYIYSLTEFKWNYGR